MSIEELDDVRVERIVTVRVLRETSETAEGWSPMDMKVQKDAEGNLLLILGGNLYRLSPRVVEAIYDVHSEVPI